MGVSACARRLLHHNGADAFFILYKVGYESGFMVDFVGLYPKIDDAKLKALLV